MRLLNVMRRFAVTVLQPYTYEVWATDEEDARRKGIDRWRAKEPAQVGGFPADIEVKEVTGREPVRESDS